MKTGEQTSGARHVTPGAKRHEKRAAKRARRRDEQDAIRKEREPQRRHTKGWAD